MNVINRKTAHLDRDPFAQSDRNTGAGKGDAPRSIGATFRNNFPASMGKTKNPPGRKTYRYPSRCK